MGAKKSAAKARSPKSSKGKAKIKDLEVKNRSAQVRGGAGPKPKGQTTKPSGGAFEVQDYGFDIEQVIN